MSFILDALKKLDHKRQRGSVPDLLTVHEPLSQGPKKRSLWPYLFLGALLLNAGIIAVWLYPWQTEKQKIVPQSSSKKPESPPAVKTGHEASDIQLPVLTQTPIVIQTTDQEANVPEEEPLSEPDSTVTVPDTKPVNSESLPLPNIAIEPEQRILNQDELPLSIQRELPSISITGHIYSNEPASRIVNINGQILREGEAVTADIKLEEITSNGVILDYKGYSFRIRTF